MCARCGAPFQMRRGGKPQRYCGPECYRLAAIARRWVSHPVTMAPCVVCSTVTRQFNGVALCSDGCRAVRVRASRPSPSGCAQYVCAECGANFEGLIRTNRVYCARKCAQIASRRSGRHARRTAERSGDVIQMSTLGDRDGWRCHICGKWVRRKGGNDRMSPSVDHLVPVSAGGPHQWSNVALAHKGCNSARGARYLT